MMGEDRHAEVVAGNSKLLAMMKEITLKQITRI